ncbi:MAG: DUF4352 domain-containing protein [Actinobacteria bacterium]|nr:DUF4352 domain-containing protein [Actinomycetota bacterium]
MPPPPPMQLEAEAGKWFEAVGIVILSLVCCGPLGLVLLWTSKKFTQKTKLIVTGVIVGLILVGGIAGIASGGSSSSSGSSSTPKVTTETTAKGNSSTTAGSATPAALCKDTADATTFDSKKQGLYAARVGVTKDDHEAALGDCVRVAGESGYVNSVKVINETYGSDQGILVNVTVRNRDKKQNDYGMFDWKIQTPAGIIDSATFFVGDTKPDLSSGKLVTGGEVTGNVVFDYAGPGTYYIIWEPDVFNDGTGIWGVVLP